MNRKHWLWAGGIGAALIAAAAGGAYALQDTAAYARIATGYAAKQTCSCLHVSGRTLESCLDEFPASGIDQIEVVPNGERVRASALFGAFTSEAIFEADYGCRIVAD